MLAINVAEQHIENIYGKTPPGLPPHELHLKVGIVMMIIRNIGRPSVTGICNGTRVQIMKLKDNVIICRFISGHRAGQEFPLSRYRFRYGGGDNMYAARREGAVAWERLQFPLRPGFVMTTNKAQGNSNEKTEINCLKGQTLDRVGLDVANSSCFAHGQFYVSMSRVRDGNNVRVFTRRRDRKVKNIVVQGIIDKEDMDEALGYMARVRNNLDQIS